MDNNRSRKDELDAFWNISELVPQKEIRFSRPRSVESVEVTDSSKAVSSIESTDTVIKRYIPTKGSSELTKRPPLDEVGAYCPVNSLIHKVTIFKYRPTYAYYDSFLKDAVKWVDANGVEADFVPFFSYVPQYDQMNSAQLKYYLWFRQNIRNGVYIKTDFGYLFLYIFELLNLGDRLDVKRSQYILMSLWNEYTSSFPSITAKLADWICDFSLLHKLPPPMNISSSIIKKVVSLKEFYISIPKDDPEECARILLRYCTSYDHHTSKFYTDANKGLFDAHIPSALKIAIEYYSKDGNILSGYDLGDSTVTRDVYAGAVCTWEQKYRIEVSYCSFSRSNELRFLVGDIIKYCENKLRAHIGVKSRMTVYSLSNELRVLLDNYFAEHLPVSRKSRQPVKRQEYDILYDVPKKPLSLTDAARIESSSWDTTRELVTAFEDEPFDIELPTDNDTQCEVLNTENEATDNDSFLPYRATVMKLIDGDSTAISRLAAELGKLPDAIVDTINEIAFDSFGDLLIEDDGMGNYTVIEDYIEYFK